MNAPLAPLLLALAQADPEAEAFQAIDAHVRAGRTLAALAEAERRVAETPTEMLRDVLGLMQSFCGLEREALATLDSLQPATHAPLESSPLEQAQALDAIPALVAAAKGRRVVILNESHHVARHRAFSLELARALRAEGFDVFAAEGFGDVTGLAERGWPDAKTGYYVVEPAFGELVRGALALGYRPVAYEWKGPSRPPGPEYDAYAQINDRETQQALHLFERVLEADEGSRVFVHCGYSHATEDWRDPGGERELAWMAARLGDLAGLDPLTIDQTIAMPRSSPEREDPHWRIADARGLLGDARSAGPKVFRNEDGSFFVAGDYAGKVDAQVFHPRLADVHGRPGWLATGRVALALPAQLAEKVPAEGRVLAQAFHAGEGPGAIPADQLVLRGRSDPARLLVPPGEYRLVLQDESGAELARAEGVRVE